jgi:hypothetical protein
MAPLKYKMFEHCLNARLPIAAPQGAGKRGQSQP